MMRTLDRLLTSYEGRISDIAEMVSRTSNMLAAGDAMGNDLGPELEHFRDEVIAYLEKHRRLADYLRRRQRELSSEGADSGDLRTLLVIVRTRYEREGRQLLAGLREFQARLIAYQG